MSNEQTGLTLADALGLSSQAGTWYALRVDDLAPTSDRGETARLLAEIVQARVELELLERRLVRRMRGFGITWATIGHALGVTKQAAQRRFS